MLYYNNLSLMHVRTDAMRKKAFEIKLSRQVSIDIKWNRIVFKKVCLTEEPLEKPWKGNDRMLNMIRGLD